MIKESIQKVVEGVNLTREEAAQIMKEIMRGEASDAQIAAFITALRMKGETVDEIASFARAMKEFCIQIRPKVTGPLIDTCGTGGDTLKTFNASTAAAFIAAGAGIAVAKHCNRSFTSKCGSADLLEALGYPLDVDTEVVERCIETVGIGFLFAPKFHPAMRYAAKPRREIGIRTVFNLLGPITNPSPITSQVLGVYAPTLVPTMASVLKDLGREEAMVVHGLDGMDEVSNIGPTLIAWLRNGNIKVLEVKPQDFGVNPAKPESILGSTPHEHAETLFRVLNGNASSSVTDLVLMNAAAAIIVGGKADDFQYAMELARTSIQSGAAYAKLKEMIRFCKGDLSKLEELESRYG